MPFLLSLIRVQHTPSFLHPLSNLLSPSSPLPQSGALSDAAAKRIMVLLLGLVNKLTGRGGIELKVENPGQYNWDPQTILRVLLQTLLNFASAHPEGDPELITRAIVKCGLYDVAAFKKAIAVARKNHIVSGTVVDALSALQAQISTVAAAEEELELDTSEWPEEFMGACVALASLSPSPLRGSPSRNASRSLALSLDLSHRSSPRALFLSLSLSLSLRSPDARSYGRPRHAPERDEHRSTDDHAPLDELRDGSL